MFYPSKFRAPKITFSDLCLELWHASQISKPKLFSEVMAVFSLYMGKWEMLMLSPLLTNCTPSVHLRGNQDQLEFKVHQVLKDLLALVVYQD